MNRWMATAAMLVAGMGASPCGNGTTIDMQVCWSKRNAEAAAHLKTVYAQALQRFAVAGESTTPLRSSQSAWTAARDNTCSFEYRLYSGGSIAPQLAIECGDRANRARSAELAALATPPKAEEPVSRTSDVRLSRLIRLYNERLTPSQGAGLAAAQRAWSTYRDAWCAIAGGACKTNVTNQRVTELESAWMGEAFWT
ncbi:MAG TPA: lysozyme inhibitor LprI family protein [Candidatus Tumulicola sp.]|jgi:uncharacterized protein YecT (DUF1311 family)